jgi:hypothetical protein
LAGESVDVDFTTVDGSSVAGTDFTTETGVLTLTADEVASIRVQTLEGAGSSAPELEVLQFYVRMTPRPGARAAFSPPLASVGITVTAQGEGGASNAGGGAGQGAGSPPVPAAGAGGDDSNADRRASSGDDGGCGCAFAAQRPERSVIGAAGLLFALLLRRSRSRRFVHGGPRAGASAHLMARAGHVRGRSAN